MRYPKFSKGPLSCYKRSSAFGFGSGRSRQPQARKAPPAPTRSGVRPVISCVIERISVQTSNQPGLCSYEQGALPHRQGHRCFSWNLEKGGELVQLYACTLQCGAARPSRDLVLRVIERIGRRPLRDATASQPCCRYTDGAIDAISECLDLVAGKPFSMPKKGA